MFSAVVFSSLLNLVAGDLGTFDWRQFETEVAPKADLLAKAVAVACIYTPQAGESDYSKCINRQKHCTKCEDRIRERCLGCYSSNGCSYGYNEDLNTCTRNSNNPSYCPVFSQQKEDHKVRCQHLLQTSIGEEQLPEQLNIFRQ